MTAVFLASFGLVFLRGLQQLNVVHGRYLAAALTPFAIAVAEVASVLFVVANGCEAIPFVGAGGACGVTLAMYIFHRRK